MRVVDKSYHLVVTMLSGKVHSYELSMPAKQGWILTGSM